MEQNNQSSQQQPGKELHELLFSIDDRISQSIVDDLQPDDIVYIRLIGSGGIPDVTRAARLKCFRIMAFLDEPQDGVILSNVVGNDEEDNYMRASAAVNLGLLDPGSAEKHLMEHLNVNDDLVLVKVIKSLGMVGSADAYEPLSKLDGEYPDFLKKQLVLAQTLVAYRNDLDADPMPFITGVQRRQRSEEQLLQLTVDIAKEPKLAAATMRYDGTDYGIQLSKSTGFEVTAGEAEWMLFINDQSAEKGIISTINRKKMIMGFLSLFLPETKSYDTQYIVLTRPAGNGEIEIMVVRTDGEMFYSGTGSSTIDALAFSVSDIERRGTAPTRVKGRLTEEKIKLDVAIPVRRRKDKLAPRTLTKKDFYDLRSRN